MKTRLLTLLVALLLSATVSAQDHLSFKGVPIKGSLTEFCNKLKGKGLKLITKDETRALLQGDFTGKSSTIYVEASDNGSNIHTVSVIVELSNEWDPLIDNYTYYKKIYSQKYGEPVACEEIVPSYMDSSNSAKMLGLSDGRVIYDCTWKTAGGTIRLSIEKNTNPDQGLSSNAGMVIIRYQDPQNIEDKIQKDLEEI